jgi:peptide methionine sulfoxide reductase MsrB
MPPLAMDVKSDCAAGCASFDTPAAAAAVREPEDCNPFMFMARTKVRCARRQRRLGRAFPHGRSETMGLRYAASRVPLQFKPGGT